MSLLKKKRSNSGPDFYLHQQVTRTHKMSCICRRCYPCAIRFTEVPFWSSILIWNISGQRTRLFWAPLWLQSHISPVLHLYRHNQIYEGRFIQPAFYILRIDIHIFYTSAQSELCQLTLTIFILFERFLLILHNNNNWIIWIMSTYLRQLINCVW